MNGIDEKEDFYDQMERIRLFLRMFMVHNNRIKVGN